MTRTALFISAALCTGFLPARAPAAAPLATAAPLADTAAVGLDSGEIASSDASLQRRPTAPAPAANPLWAIPLSALSETRERPPFAPTRRPPPVMADTRPRPPERTPVHALPPEQPPLKLIGTIVGEAKGFGLFIDPSSKDVVRLSTGGTYRGWLLRTVHERSVVLEKNHLNQTLALPTPLTLRPATTRHPVKPADATNSGTLLRHSQRPAPIDATNAYR